MAVIDDLKDVLEPLLEQFSLSLPTWWTDADYVRFLSQNGYDLENAAKSIKNNLMYLDNHRVFNIEEGTEKILKDGGISILGRDKLGQPNILMHLGKCPSK